MKKNNFKEDFNDRINDDKLGLTTSEELGDLRIICDQFFRNYEDYKFKLNLVDMNLDRAYNDGIIGRTVINGFNNEIDKLTMKMGEVIKGFNKVCSYDADHLDIEKYLEYENENDFFKSHYNSANK